MMYEDVIGLLGTGRVLGTGCTKMSSGGLLGTGLYEDVLGLPAIEIEQFLGGMYEDVLGLPPIEIPCIYGSDPVTEQCTVGLTITPPDKMDPCNLPFVYNVDNTTLLPAVQLPVRSRACRRVTAICPRRKGSTPAPTSHIPGRRERLPR